MIFVRGERAAAATFAGATALSSANAEILFPLVPLVLQNRHHSLRGVIRHRLGPADRALSGVGHDGLDHVADHAARTRAVGHELLGDLDDHEESGRVVLRRERLHDVVDLGVHQHVADDRRERRCGDVVLVAAEVDLVAHDPLEGEERSVADVRLVFHSILLEQGLSMRLQRCNAL